MTYEAKIILDSISRGHRLTTIQATFPRFILAEVNTHRMFSRNSASSRAIPVERRIEQLRKEPFIPQAFGKNRPGMQSSENLTGDDAQQARDAWGFAIDQALFAADDLVKVGVHKQWANRVIETFAWHTAVITATEWSNHDALRCHPDASPEYKIIAEMMREARDKSTPRGLPHGEWHMPYVLKQDGTVDQEDFNEAHAVFDSPGRGPNVALHEGVTRILRKVSVGRCAAVSYERQEIKNFTKDVERYGKLRFGGHMSPFEHVARPMTRYEYDTLFAQKKVEWDEYGEAGPAWRWIGLGRGNGENPASSDSDWLHFCGNYQGWIQERKLIPNEHDFSRVKGT